MATAVGQGSVGNAYIDGLLSGVKWNGSFTFSFPQATTDYEPGNPEADVGSGFTPVTFQQREATRAIMTGVTFGAGTNVMKATNVNSFIAVSVSQTANDGFNGLGDIRLGQANDPATAYAYYPNNAANGSGGDVWFGTAFNYTNPVMGNYAYHTHIHELGHAMGLKHSQETGGPANVAVPSDRDAIEWTVMSYRSYVGGPATGGYTYGTWDAPQTFMVYDIQALQTMYGAYYGSNSGATTYTWSSTTGQTFINGVSQGTPGGNKIFMTVWDGGGIDTYDMSNFGGGVNISLVPGSSSITSDAQRANLGAGNQAQGNVYNSLLFGGNLASIIENAIGGAGDDTIGGNQVANILTGNGGADDIYGGDGGDTLYGGSGNDYMKGGAGADGLYGGADDDTLKGGGGSDVLDGGTGNDTAAYDDGGSVTVNLGTGATGGDAAGDSYVSIENVTGSNSADTLTGNGVDNILTGLGGNDTLVGGAGADTLYGGDDNDVLNGGSGFDFLYGGNGDDTIQHTGGDFGGDVDGGAGTDWLDLFGWTNSAIAFNVNLGASNYQFLPNAFGVNGTYSLINVENVQGSNFNDTITGDGLANVLKGAGGNDILNGGGGIDILFGDDGNDTITDTANNDVYGGDGDDTIINTFVSGGIWNGGNGNDTIDLSQDNFSFNINLSLASFSAFSATFSNFENAIGSQGNDTITGSSGVNILSGHSGADTIYGGGGNDTLNGGAGNDIMYGGSDVDSLYGGDGDDQMTYVTNEAYDNYYGGNGVDTVTLQTFFSDTYQVDLALGQWGYNGNPFAFAMQGIENIVTGANNDTIIGSAANNNIDGGAGADAISGGGGVDNLYGGDGDDTLNGGLFEDNSYGGNGNDTFLITGANWGDNADGGAGIDLLDLSGSNNGGAGFLVNLASAFYRFNPNAIGADGIYNLTGVENVNGSAFSDSITGDGLANVLNGGGGNDSIIGGGGIDNLYGGDGNDTLNGGTFEDNSFGGNGNDTFFVTGADWGDNVDGGAGIDLLNLSGSNNGGAGFLVNLDSLYYRFNPNAIGANGIYTLTGVENVTGSAFNDQITGDGLANALNGGGGNDFLNGGLGNDTLTGGAGSDTFQFVTAPNTGTNNDTITDFNAALDTMTLDNAFFALLGAPGALAANLFKNLTLSAQDADDRILYNDTTGTIVYDTNGLAAGGVIHFATLTANPTITAADFVVV